MDKNDSRNTKVKWQIVLCKTQKLAINKFNYLETGEFGKLKYVWIWMKILVDGEMDNEGIDRLVHVACIFGVLKLRSCRTASEYHNSLQWEFV